MTISETLAERPFRELLDAFSALTPSPGGGSVAALVAASAAALVQRCASATERPGSEEVRLRAAALRDELLVLADRDASVLAAFAASADKAAGAAVEASGPPALVRVAAEEVATLAESLERDGARAYRGEAHCARVLARAAASIAESIIVMNLAFIRAQG